MSSTPKRMSYGGDRFIPVRRENKWDNFSVTEDYDSILCKSERPHSSKRVYTMLLGNELLGEESDSLKENCPKTSISNKTSLLNFSSPVKDISRTLLTVNFSPHIGNHSHKLLTRPDFARPRKVSKNPHLVLDAPLMADDYYLHLLDWSPLNIIAVILDYAVYLRSCVTKKIVILSDFSEHEPPDKPTSVAWNNRGNLLAVGSAHGRVTIWDIESMKLVTAVESHQRRVGVLAWNANTLFSGGKDRNIHQADVRAPDCGGIVGSHGLEVCSLKWSPCLQYLASGGNDNLVKIWNTTSDKPVLVYDKHKAAVRALAWSPHHHGLMASGGGTADQCINFWNVLTGKHSSTYDTTAQVCNIAWSKHARELVSTHGFAQHRVVVWKYPAMSQVAALTGHKSRVLYMATGPNDEDIVTGAGDETLRFWKVFSKTAARIRPQSVLELHSGIR